MITKCKTVVYFSVAMLATMILLAVVPLALATGPPVWEGDAYSSGVPVTSAVLNLGQQYRIVVNGTWWYDFDDNLAADAQYYTDDPGNSVYWGNYFAAPGGGSFLQINGQNVSWGPFSNGDTGHRYTIYYVGSGAALTFRIVDLVDSDYDNNVCHIHIIIYTEITVGGRIEDSNLWETAAYTMAGGLIFATAVSVVLVNYHRKTREPKD